MSDVEEMGPIDWVLVEFDGPLTGEALPPLLDVIDRGLIRLLDIMFLVADDDGDVTAVEISELPDDEAVHVSFFEGASSGLLGTDDIEAAGSVLEPGTRAVMMVYENTWAAPFATAVRRAGGQLVDSGRIPVHEILAALEDTGSAGA